ncbi:hypothetical protein TSAR_014462 [Trichomalopsis sarcophagae]|uniref:F-box domain-containing protein n=1 Tax=Trichomalopsis sarcophagae TaxID=543379 RepID=A0A232FAS9_9HYME|nr:hypothetical protein TSAR_014462 [Trichomalopsis sarcophagae]
MIVPISLDTPCLLDAARVSRKWLAVSKFTFTFRQQVRRHILRRNQRLVQTKVSYPNIFNNSKLLLKL